jgi:uroporphyrinogen-III synthase
MRILLTRARTDAERTAARLAALGHSANISPVFEIVATEAAVPSDGFDAIVATSAHAFTGDLRSVGRSRLYAVGERTREAAERAGWSGPIHVGGTAQAVVALLHADLRQGQRFLYLAGRDRKPEIETAAKETGLEIQIVETYAAREIRDVGTEAGRALRTGEVDAVLHYSRRSADLFIAMVERAELWPQAARLRHYALSNDVAAPLIAAGAQTLVAAKPHEDDLLALLARADRS